METRKYLMKLDLLLVAIFGFMTWHTQIGIIFPLSFVLLRLFTSFSLADKKKANWLPISIWTVWMAITFFTENGWMIDKYYFEPVYKLVRSIVLLFGGNELRYINYPGDLTFNSAEQSIAFFLTASITLFYVAWLLLFPIIEYILQWRKKEFIHQNGSKSRIIFIVSYFIVSVVLALIISECLRTLYFGTFNIILLLLSGLPVLLYFKESIEISKDFKLYSALIGIFVFAYVLGCEMDNNPSLVGLMILPPLFYFIISRSNNIRMHYRDWVFFIFAGLSFGMAHFACLWGRMLLLATSAFIYGYEVYQFFIQSNRSKKYSFALFLTMTFILPTLIIGYNQYTVLSSRKISKYDLYLYAPNGVLRTYNPATNTCGLRDRYGEIMPCKYDYIFHLDNCRKPFVKIRKGHYWGIFDIEKNKVVVEPKFTDIIPYGENTYKLILDNDSCTYFHTKSYYYSEYSDDELWKISKENENPFLIE